MRFLMSALSYLLQTRGKDVKIMAYKPLIENETVLDKLKNICLIQFKKFFER
jgi:hypothetical protein